jgi:hypothetical protein
MEPHNMFSYILNELRMLIYYLVDINAIVASRNEEHLNTV